MVKVCTALVATALLFVVTAQAGGSTPRPPTPAPTTPFSGCSKVIAIPGNAHSLTNQSCSVCNNGAYRWYPCDTPGLCYCEGTQIPAQYLLPFSGCSSVVKVPGQNQASNSQCATCNNGNYRWWPCEAQHVNVLCRCATTNAPATPRPPTPAPTTAGGWSNCSQVIAIPGNAHNINNQSCSVCNNGAYRWYPCDTPGLCYCKGSQIPAQYLLPFSGCTSVVKVPGQNQASNSQCATCNNGNYRWWPCEAQHVNVLCRCATTNAPPTPRPPTPAPTTKAPIPPATPIPADQIEDVNAGCGTEVLNYWVCNETEPCIATASRTVNCLCDLSTKACAQPTCDFYEFQTLGRKCKQSEYWTNGPAASGSNSHHGSHSGSHSGSHWWGSHSNSNAHHMKQQSHSHSHSGSSSSHGYGSNAPTTCGSAYCSPVNATCGSTDGAYCLGYVVCPTGNCEGAKAGQACILNNKQGKDKNTFVQCSRWDKYLSDIFG